MSYRPQDKRPGAPWALPKTAPLELVQRLPAAIRAPLGIPDPRPVQFSRPGEFIEDLPLSQMFVSAVLEAMGDSVASHGQVQLLTDLSERYNEIEAKLTEWSVSATVAKYEEQLGTIADAPKETRFLSKEALQTEARRRRHGLHEQLGALSNEARVIVKTILTDTQTVMARFAAQREKMERSEAEKFGVEFQPSVILATAWQASWRLTEQSGDPCLQHSPAQMLKHIPINLTPAN
ncbi:MAG: hypothetical protein P4N60_00465 [Verrucomicrobiae bacterium]|nr:hypothetical protein [Verrucomicrobiae bacterium]